MLQSGNCLLVISFLVVNFLVVGVLPRFAMVFTASQMKLPLPTQLVLGTSLLLQRLWWVFILAIIFAGFLFKRYMDTERGKYRIHAIALNFPIFGPLYTKIQIARFSRTLSALIGCGVPLLESLSVVEHTITNISIRQAIQDIRSSITKGKPLVEPIKASGFFSPMVIQMVATGERSGELDKVLEEIASFYEPEIEHTIKNLTTILEPIMLLIMGVVVAFIALSVLLPIFNLIKVFRS